jgi:hypothetical protein
MNDLIEFNDHRLSAFRRSTFHGKIIQLRKEFLCKCKYEFTVASREFFLSGLEESFAFHRSSVLLWSKFVLIVMCIAEYR